MDLKKEYERVEKLAKKSKDWWQTSTQGKQCNKCWHMF
jgi:hypothetical protein